MATRWQTWRLITILGSRLKTHKNSEIFALFIQFLMFFFSSLCLLPEVPLEFSQILILISLGNTFKDTSGQWVSHLVHFTNSSSDSDQRNLWCWCQPNEPNHRCESTFQMWLFFVCTKVQLTKCANAPGFVLTELNRLDVKAPLNAGEICRGNVSSAFTFGAVRTKHTDSWEIERTTAGCSLSPILELRLAGRDFFSSVTMVSKF